MLLTVPNLRHNGMLGQGPPVYWEVNTFMQLELIKNCVGSRCMILSKDNQLLFFGEVAYCDLVNKTIRVDGDSQAARQFVRPMDWVKLSIRQGSQDPHFILVEGEVDQVINRYFVLKPKLVIEKSEEREYFRQPVMRKVEITAVNGEEADKPGVIVDVSVTGVGLQSNEVYEIGDCLRLSGQRLREGGPAHDLEFVVVRQQALETGPYRHFYGCKYEHLSTEAQDKLCCDIFALQAVRLRSVREK